MLFTAAGAFNTEVADVSNVTGDVGTNVGAFYGFPPGILIGEKHVEDAVTAAAAPVVLAAYQYLDELTCAIVKTSPLGRVMILSPNIYCIGEAAVLNGDITLDAQGDPDAVFIFQINGEFLQELAHVITYRGCLVIQCVLAKKWGIYFWGGSLYRGNAINDGLIHLLEGSSLQGRALSTAGAIDLHNNIVTIGEEAVASIISASDTTTFCLGDSVILTGNVGGIWSTGDTTENLTVKTSGDYFVTNTAVCNIVDSNHIIVTVVDCGAAVPISTWALILGGVLIASFAFIRYRRIF